MFDRLPPGPQWYWKADFVRELSDEAIALHYEHGSRMPTMLSTMHLYPIDGAAARVKNNATAWAYRDAKWAEVIVGVDPDPANKEKITAWARDYWTALHPLAPGLRELHRTRWRDRVKAATEQLPAPGKIKKKSDPTILRVDQNQAREVGADSGGPRHRRAPLRRLAERL